MSKNHCSLGKSLIRDQNKKLRKRDVTSDGSRHTAELFDGYDWGRLNLNSVTEQSSLDDFLTTAQLADKEFTAERLNISIVTADAARGLLSEMEKNVILSSQEKYKHCLSVPRRPNWDETTSKEELDVKEKEAFLQWRRKLALVQEEEHINLTPYEKNLELWRQLWRTVERSDVIVQILDARNPLLFRCKDIELYVKEMDKRKLNLLLLNKADYLTKTQRQFWANYFANIGVQIVFFSALQQMQENSENSDHEPVVISETACKNSGNNCVMSNAKTSKSVNETALQLEEMPVNVVHLEEATNNTRNSDKLFTREELIMYFKALGRISIKEVASTTVGLVGYPNVGKSSTINALLMCKKVSVSATPGKTKHFQTLLLDSELCLCDCPGLVFPNFVSSKAEMIINGILPIDQMTNYIPAVTLVASLIPRDVLQDTYGIMLPALDEGKDPLSPPTAEELLNAYGSIRGFMTSRGLPDTARSAKHILKDFVTGKLLYCYAPPDENPEVYNCQFATKSNISAEKLAAHHKTLTKKARNGSNASKDIDQDFFKQINFQVHMKGVQGVTGYVIKGNSENSSNSSNKPWKKHNNRNKREKLRRVYADLDK